jgi:hypothetical protein
LTGRRTTTLSIAAICTLRPTFVPTILTTLDTVAQGSHHHYLCDAVQVVVARLVGLLACSTPTPCIYAETPRGGT